MKILITATVMSHVAQFHKPLAAVLHRHGCTVEVAAHDNLAEKNGLKLDWADKVYNVPFERRRFRGRTSGHTGGSGRLSARGITMLSIVILRWEES